MWSGKRISIAILIAVAIVGASFGLSLAVMNYLWPLCPQGLAKVQLKGPFQKFLPAGGYIASLPAWNAIANSEGYLERSPTAVCENNFLLGSAHSAPNDVATKGNGRFSHWKDVGVIFSATDNSDPNTNQRQYWIVRLR